VIPAALLLAGIPFFLLDRSLKGVFGRWSWIAFFVIVTPALVWINMWNYKFYFVTTQASKDVYEKFEGRDTSVARYLEGLDRDKYHFVHQQKYNDYPIIPFLLKQERFEETLFQYPDHLPLRREIARDIHYLLEPWRTSIPEAFFRHYYPSGVYKEHKDPWGNAIFYTYVAPVEEVNALHGLTARYVGLDSTDRIWER